MLFLLSNDDGYQAKGLNSLIDILRPMADILVVAPSDARSGASLSISSHTPLQSKMICREEASEGLGSLTVYSCTGTPVDCIKMAFEYYLPEPPDLVIAGINHGDNAAVNAHYSGTVGITIEGTIKHIPSIAFSSSKGAADADFSAMKPYIIKIVNAVLRDGLPDGVLLNVNAGDFEEFKGLRICHMGMGQWREELQRKDHPRGWCYYWIAGYYDPEDADDETTDTWAIRNGYVAITPVKIDITAYESMASLKKCLEK